MRNRSLPFLLLIFWSLNSAAQQKAAASQPVWAPYVTQDLLPDSGNTRNIGSTGQSWKNVYMTGNLYWNGLSMLQVTGGENLFSGPSAGNGTSTGTYNTATGYYAMNKNTTGNNNTAHGHGALYANTTGSGNAAFGTNALKQNTIGIGNTAIGDRALYGNATGTYNTAVGNLAMYFNKTGHYNTATGFQSMFSNMNGGIIPHPAIRRSIQILKAAPIQPLDTGHYIPILPELITLPLEMRPFITIQPGAIIPEVATNL